MPRRKGAGRIGNGNASRWDEWRKKRGRKRSEGGLRWTVFILRRGEAILPQEQHLRRIRRERDIPSPTSISPHIFFTEKRKKREKVLGVWGASGVSEKEKRFRRGEGGSWYKEPDSIVNPRKK